MVQPTSDLHVDLSAFGASVIVTAGDNQQDFDAALGYQNEHLGSDPLIEIQT